MYQSIGSVTRKPTKVLRSTSSYCIISDLGMWSLRRIICTVAMSVAQWRSFLGVSVSSQAIWCLVPGHQQFTKFDAMEVPLDALHFHVSFTVCGNISIVVRFDGLLCGLILVHEFRVCNVRLHMAVHTVFHCQCVTFERYYVYIYDTYMYWFIINAAYMFNISSKDGCGTLWLKENGLPNIHLPDPPCSKYDQYDSTNWCQFCSFVWHPRFWVVARSWHITADHYF